MPHRYFLTFVGGAKVKQLLYAESVSKKIGSKQILQNISLNLSGGNVYGFVGENGSGKTMLFRILSGLVKPTTGKVCLNRTDIHKGRCSERIGVIIENSCMWPELTGWENLLFLGSLNKRISKADIRYLLGISLFSSAQQEEKAALLITHYGSSDPQTRALTLDVVTREAQEAFPQFTVREAYISPIVRKRLAKEGVYKDSPTDALLKLRAEGYRTIYVQSTTLIEGSEMTSVRRDADKLRPFFKEIKVGNPLLYSVEDCEKVIGILTAEQPEKKEDIVYVGHGNQLPSTATYAMLDFMMKAHGLKNFHVSTIEGYPTLDATLLQLKETRPKSVTLVPLLLVCGNHTKEDIAGVWKTELEKQSYQVNVRMQGLGENKAIRQLYMEHIKAMLKD